MKFLKLGGGMLKTEDDGTLVTKSDDSSPGWGVNHVPAENAQATITRNAAAGLRHVARAIVAHVRTGAAAPAAGVATLRLRDGASGAGAVLLEVDVEIPAAANAVRSVVIPDLDLPGTIGNAMTLEFGAAGGANTFERVNLIGYDTAF